MVSGNLNKDYQGRKVLITGGLGFIGSNLAHRLVGLGTNVTLVDRLEQSSMSYLVKGQNYIFNLAGQVLHIDSTRNPYLDLDINCRGHLILLEACRQNNPNAKIVFAGTRQVYGKPVYLPLDETHPLQPVDINGIHKQAAEWYHLLYYNCYGLRTTSLRLTNTYGPRQLVKHDRVGFVGWFVRQAINGQEIKIFGDGLQLRDFTYIDSEGYEHC